MEKPDYFMHLDLPTLGKVGLIEGKGIHWFIAMTKAKGDVGLMFKYLLLQLLYVNDKPVDEKFIDDIPIKDASYLTSVLGTMIEEKYI
ncbi:hypothetical protein [Flavobacterium phage FL-1]|nr:hypothetical protein [Flavobacterium phage FL-1]